LWLDRIEMVKEAGDSFEEAESCCLDQLFAAAGLLCLHRVHVQFTELDERDPEPQGWCRARSARVHAQRRWDRRWLHSPSGTRGAKTARAAASDLSSSGVSCRSATGCFIPSVLAAAHSSASDNACVPTFSGSLRTSDSFGSVSCAPAHALRQQRNQ
jgi:hypothetical protein